MRQIRINKFLWRNNQAMRFNHGWQYKITIATYARLVGVIFEYVIINDVKAPKWFTEFVEKRFEPEIANIKARLGALEHNDEVIFDILKRNDLH